MLYVKFLELNVKSPRTVYNYVLGVKIMHHWNGQPVDAFNAIRVKHILRAIVKVSTHVVKQAAPVTPGMLAQIRSLLDDDDPDDVTFWAVCLVAFMLMLRKSNLVPDTLAAFDRNKQLTRGHLGLVESAVWVTIVWSKTLQFHLKDLRFPLLAIPGLLLCPVKAIKRMCELVPLSDDRPCFARVNGAPWTYRQFQNKFKKCLSVLGYKQNLFSSHSFRRGGCSFCFQAGVPSELIQIIGDWKSDTYKHYCHTSDYSRARACAAFRKELLKLGF